MPPVHEEAGNNSRPGDVVEVTATTGIEDQCGHIALVRDCERTLKRRPIKTDRDGSGQHVEVTDACRHPAIELTGREAQ